MISIRSGVLVAVNRPPGCGIISAIWLSGFAGSGFGLLGLTEATSKAAPGVAAGSCADAAVAASRMARAKPHVERIIFISTLQLLPGNLVHVWRMRLSDQGAATLAIRGNNAGDSIETAFVADIPASCTPAMCSTVTHAAPNAADIATAPPA